MSPVQWVPERGEGIVVLANSQRACPLFADILRDWTAWKGRGPRGLAVVSVVVLASWRLVALGASWAAWWAARTLAGLRSGTYAFLPRARAARGRRFAALPLTTLIAAGIAWAATREYPFLSSPPHVVGPLALDAAALLSALCSSVSLSPPPSPGDR